MIQPLKYNDNRFFYQFALNGKNNEQENLQCERQHARHVARNFKGGGRVCPGTFLGEVHSPDPHHLPFPQTRAMGLDNTMGVGGTMRYDVLHIRT